MSSRRPPRAIIAGILMLALIVGLTWWAIQGRRVNDLDLGLRAIDSGDLITATNALERLRRDPQAVDKSRLLAGAIKLRCGKSAAALAEFSRINPEGELHSAALRWTGECLYSLDRWNEAESCFRQLLELGPGNPEAYRWLATITYDLGELDQTVELLNQLAKVAPHDYRPWRMLGSIHRDFEQYSEAESEYRQAMEIQPSDADKQEIVRELADVLMKQKKFGEALTVLQSAPNRTADVIASEGSCHRGLGDLPSARSCLNRALELSESDPLVLQLAAAMAMDEGRSREAANLFQRILTNDPHNVECRYQLAMARRDLGDTDGCDVEMKRVAESRQLLEKLTRLSAQAMKTPGNADVLEQMAEVCEALGRQKVAQVWRRAVKTLQSSAKNSE